MFKAVGSGQASQAVHPAFLTPTFDSDCEGNIKAFLRKKASINIYSCRLQNQSLLQWSKVGKTLVDLTHPPLYSSSWMYNLNGLWVGAKTPPPPGPLHLCSVLLVLFFLCRPHPIWGCIIWGTRKHWNRQSGSADLLHLWHNLRNKSKGVYYWWNCRRYKHVTAG